MADEIHQDNATPDATDDDIKRMDKDTPGHPGANPGASAEEGAGESPDPADTEHTDDPKGSGRPV